MFPVESLHPLYTEEKSAKNAAMRAAQEQALIAQSAMTSCASTPALTPSTSAPQQSQRSQGPCPQTLTTALLNRQQQAPRPSGFFGNIIQGFSRTNSGTATPCLTRAAPTPLKEKTQAEVEAVIAERKRDADIVMRHAFLVSDIFNHHTTMNFHDIRNMNCYTTSWERGVGLGLRRLASKESASRLASSLHSPRHVLKQGIPAKHSIVLLPFDRLNVGFHCLALVNKMARVLTSSPMRLRPVASPRIDSCFIDSSKQSVEATMADSENRDSTLTVPSSDGDYAENVPLTSKTSASTQTDNTFPSANPPPKGSNHSRTASTATKASNTLAQPLNIVILGASFAGLSIAHAFLDDTLHHLRTTSTAPNYRLILISPSTHIYWNIGAPRALVALGLIKQDDLFIPIEPGFQRHKGRPYTIIQGRALTWDNNARTIEIELLSAAARKRSSHISMTDKRKSDDPLSHSPVTQTIPYHALILATGSSAHSSLLSLHGPHTDTVAALNATHSKLASAKSILVCGGGTSGVETAGQLATYLNYTRHWPLRRAVPSPKKIILLTGTDRCLPTFPTELSAKAERKLRSLGVDIRHNLRVTSVREDSDLTGQVQTELSDNTSLITDAYIACTGVSPNTAYAPRPLLDPTGYIATNAATCRVDPAGARVYALGDVASFSQNYTLDAYAAVPVVQANLLKDLLAHELRLASPYGGNQVAIDALQDAVYVRREKDSLLCPVTRFGGVGILIGWGLPSWLVHRMKGRDYRVRKAERVVVDGGNPYARPGGGGYE
ncbi:hypothetical protein Q7P37_000660 [Cladosporium fusiforme]